VQSEQSLIDFREAIPPHPGKTKMKTWITGFLNNNNKNKNCCCYWRRKLTVNLRGERKVNINKRRACQASCSSSFSRYWSGKRKRKKKAQIGLITDRCKRDSKAVGYRQDSGSPTHEKLSPRLHYSKHAMLLFLGSPLHKCVLRN